MSDKKKYPRADALKVAKELCDALKPVTDRLIVAGSLRRRKDLVGDVEILYVPKLSQGIRVDLFGARETDNLVDRVLKDLLRDHQIEKRLTIKGSETWGEKNKFAVHHTGIPVDFFSAHEGNWFNYIVCRTGSAESNTRIAFAAQAKGGKWNPYGAGFTDECGLLRRVTAERDVFDLVGLPYQEPWERI